MAADKDMNVNPTTTQQPLTTTATTNDVAEKEKQASPSATTNNNNTATATKNFKNLRISPPEENNTDDDSMKCQCPHYFNTECITDPLLSSENIPSTVKSVSPDACCTYGTHYPNRVFVGHLPGKANATDLADFFREFGTVLEGKVVLDSFGRSRRFGFITFANHDDVQNVLSKIPIFFKGKKINVGPAVKKMFGAEFTPPPMSPSVSSGGEAANHSDESESDDGNNKTNETIITVPPVNEPKDPVSPLTPKSGNVWLKINMKPKVSPKRLIPEKRAVTTTAPSRFSYLSSRQPPQQQQLINPYQSNTIFFYPPPMYTVPTSQGTQYYANQGAQFYAQSPPVTYYENGQAYFLNPVGQYGSPPSQPPPIYFPGPLSVA